MCPESECQHSTQETIVEGMFYKYMQQVFRKAAHSQRPLEKRKYFLCSFGEYTFCKRKFRFFYVNLFPWVNFFLGYVQYRELLPIRYGSIPNAVICIHALSLFSLFFFSHFHLKTDVKIIQRKDAWTGMFYSKISKICFIDKHVIINRQVCFGCNQEFAVHVLCPVSPY